jgi:N-dimethylarginine dimethylaminohydrolase
MSNAGVVLPHLDKTFLLSNFRAAGREGEEVEAATMVRNLGFECHQVPYFFEGEAEFKWLRDNIYVGGYGTRTSPKALDWISEKFDARIIRVEERDPYLYHLDCSILSLAKDLVMAYTAGITREALKELEDIATVIPVTKRLAYAGATNSIRVGFTLFNASCISELPSKHPAYPSGKDEEAKNKFLETVCKNYGLELVFVNLSEMLKSGALLSCCVLHLSYDEVNLAKP